ncbi:MAG: hypothetical protein INQ03_25745 [Candidatus Heimdallarchaeota archaeon]|nr:hypothetical protein [Candidatus Heimdallarchaeota archaeon]
MASTIKMKEDDKRRLDELRANLLINGINLKQEELISKLIELGEIFLLDLNHIPMKKLSPSKKKKILSRGYKMGSNSSTIDEELYGGE